MMAWALFPENPYGYYVLLRLVCCPLLVFLFFLNIAMIKVIRPVEYPTDLVGWPGVFVVSAILYNPIIQVHLNRGIWNFLNIATILILGAFWFLRVRAFSGTLVFSKKTSETEAPIHKISDLDECKAPLSGSH